MTGFFDNNGDPQLDPFTVLKIQHNASEADIKKAYRTQMLQLHPDKLPPNLPAEEIAAVTDKFHTVKDAYEFLTSPQYLTARRLYTAKMASRRAEYERREAFLRRQSMNNTSASDPTPARGYVYQQQYSHRQRTNMTRQPPPSSSRSYAVPPRRKSETNLNQRQGRSEPNLNPEYDTKYARGQSTERRRVDKMGGVGQARMNGADVNLARERGRTGGGRATANNNAHASSGRAARTKSSTAARNKESSHHRAKSQPHSSQSKLRQREHTRHDDAARFGNAAGWRGSVGSNKENRKRSSSKDHRQRSRTMSREEEKKVRSRSAPARYYSNNKSEKSFGTRRAANKDLPKEFFCPLTKRLMKDPVFDNDGNTYEREAIERWLRAQSSSPITNEYLSLDMLRPNKVLKSQIYKATGKCICV